MKINLTRGGLPLEADGASQYTIFVASPQQADDNLLTASVVLFYMYDNALTVAHKLSAFAQDIKKMGDS